MSGATRSRTRTPRRSPAAPGALYDKLRVLVTEMETLGKQLNTAEKTYTNIYKNMTTGRANLVRQVEQFRELGAQVKKPMSRELIERAADDD